MSKSRWCATILLLIAGVALCSVAWAETVGPRVMTKSQVPPTYPPAAQMARFGGSVTLAAEVKTDGTVGEIEIVESDHPNLGFEQAASNAVRQWLFHPAEIDGQSVEALTYVRLHFRSERSLRPGGHVAGGPIASSIGGFVPGGVGKQGPTGGDQPASGNGSARIQTVSLPPMVAGAMYDRTKLIPSPSGGIIDQPASLGRGR